MECVLLCPMTMKGSGQGVTIVAGMGKRTNGAMRWCGCADGWNGGEASLQPALVSGSGKCEGNLKYNGGGKGGGEGNAFQGGNGRWNAAAAAFCCCLRCRSRCLRCRSRCLPLFRSPRAASQTDRAPLRGTSIGEGIVGHSIWYGDAIRCWKRRTSNCSYCI